MVQIVWKKRKEKPVVKEVVTYLHDADDYDSCDKQTQRARRMEKFAQLMHLKTEGKCTLSKGFNMDSDYWEMCAEIKFHTDMKNREHGVDISKQGLVYLAWAIEYFNDKYDPFGINLKGWSEHMELTKDNYTSTFAELYEKYKGSTRKIEPEVKLIALIAISAASFHATKAAAKIPGLEEVLKTNPEMAAKIENMISQKMMGQAKQKTPEEQQRELNHNLYQTMLAQKRQMQQPVQQPTQQPTQPSTQQPLPTTIHRAELDTPFKTAHNPNGVVHLLGQTQIPQTVPDKQQPVIKQPPNIQSILNKFKPLMQPATIEHTSEGNKSVSSVKPNARVEVSESMRDTEVSSNTDTADIKITRTIKPRKKVVL